MSRPAREHGTPLVYDCPACPPPTLYPTRDGRLGLALTPDGLHLSLWEPGEPCREVKLEAHTALDLARRIEREYGGRL